jgi:alkylation response protein AidB-like acyl-CoA dehydrogenase
MSQHAGPVALTQLCDDEQMFRDTVRRFAVEQISPLVRDMDESQKMDAGLIKKLFDLGLMGIEIPEQYGGAGGTFFNAILAVEEISAVDPSVGVMVDVQNTLCVNALVRWANDEQKKKYLTRLAADTIGSYALSEASSGSDAFALQTRAVKRGNDYVLIGKKEDKLGIRASSTCALNFNDCVVPAAQVLGEPGKGYKIAIETLNEGRIGIGSQMLGLAAGAWGHAAKWAKERKQFGKTLVEFQAMQFQLAEMATEIEAARLMVYNAARLKDAKLDFLKEAAMCKYFASHVAERVASLAVEVYGGSGFVKDYPVEKLYRDAKIGKIYEGTSFMQLATIAKLTLGKV